MNFLYEPFLLRALAATFGLAIIAAPLGCAVVWQRMAYFGETIAQASLIGVALALALNADTTISIAAVALALAGLVMAATRQKTVPTDSILGLLHHGALALGVIATALLKGPSVDLMGYLFGDVYAISTAGLFWVYGGGALVLAGLAALWTPVIRISLHEDLAAAEGVRCETVRMAFMCLLAITIAMAIQIAGILLSIAFLVVPAVAARPFAATPERMALLSAAVSIAAVLIGTGMSVSYDIPGGPAIVLIMVLIAGASLTVSSLRRT